MKSGRDGGDAGRGDGKIISKSEGREMWEFGKLSEKGVIGDDKEERGEGITLFDTSLDRDTKRGERTEERGAVTSVREQLTKLRNQRG